MRTTLLPVVSLALVSALVAGCQTSQAPSVSDEVTSDMKEHFEKVAAVQDAVIRGDIESAKEPARWLAEHQEAAGLPAGSEGALQAMKLAAQRAADAKDIHMTANAVATMASACGTCHQTSQVTPTLPVPAAPEGVGLPGHMRAHQQAVEYLYQGLIVPSEALWQKGAELLKGAPMATDSFPDDPNLTDDIKLAEGRIHEFAEMARSTTDAKVRVNLYGEIITTCASCHSLHGRAWGPGLPQS